MTDLAPLVVRHTMETQPVATVGNDLLTPICRAPFAGTVSGVSYVPVADKNGADTNSRTLNLYNRAQDGTGTTLVATLALVAGVNLANDDEKTITLSGTAANLVVAEGDVLTWESLHVGTGISDPGGLVIVTFSRS